MFKQKILKISLLAVAMFMFSLPPMIGRNGDPIEPKTIDDVEPLYNTLMTYTKHEYANGVMHICNLSAKDCAITKK